MSGKPLECLKNIPFNKNTLGIISSFLIDTTTLEKELVDWIPQEKLNLLRLCENPNVMSIIYNYKDLCIECWKTLCSNKNAVSFIRENLDKLDDECWEILCGNENAISIISENIDKINILGWKKLCLNENAISIIEKNLDKLDEVCWSSLCFNKNAISIITNNKNKIDGDRSLCSVPYGTGLLLRNLCENDKTISIISKDVYSLNITQWRSLCWNENAISIIEKNLDKLDVVCWSHLCWNKKAVSIIYQNLDKLDDSCWRYLCFNKNAVDIIRENIDKLDDICWNNLCGNENAIDIIRENLHKLDTNCWYYLCGNKNAISLVRENLNKLNTDCWINLCRHINDIKFLKDNSYKFNFLCWKTLSDNSFIFQPNVKEEIKKMTTKIEFFLKTYNFTLLTINSTLPKMFVLNHVLKSNKKYTFNIKVNPYIFHTLKAEQKKKKLQVEFLRPYVEDMNEETENVIVIENLSEDEFNKLYDEWNTSDFITHVNFFSISEINIK